MSETVEEKPETAVEATEEVVEATEEVVDCLLYTSPSPRDS